MSAADKHRAAAENYLRRGYEEDADFAALLVSMANASALLAIEARLGEVAELLQPRPVEVGTVGIVHNPNGLTAEQVSEAFDRVAAIATARQKGGH